MKPIKNFTNSEITKAGKVLSKNEDLQEVKYAENIINQWREYHYWAITGIQQNVRNHVKRINDPNSIVAQRLKKMATIKNKVRRYPNMRLHTMQDIGGCRAIFSEIESVYKLQTSLINSSMKHNIEIKKDYIKNPKDSGYRGIHLVATYISDKNPSYNGLKVEIQIRTYYQHLWSTAVETVGTFLNCELKSGEGPIEWLDFFKLISLLIAVEEDCTNPEILTSSSHDTICKIKELDRKHTILKTISGISKTCYNIYDKKAKVRKTYVIVIDKKRAQTNVKEFNKFKQANEYYIEEEKNIDNNAVLIAANSLEELKKVYPNYFMDIKEFYNLIIKLLEVDNNEI